MDADSGHLLRHHRAGNPEIWQHRSLLGKTEKNGYLSTTARTQVSLLLHEAISHQLRTAFSEPGGPGKLKVEKAVLEGGTSFSGSRRTGLAIFLKNDFSIK